MRATYFTWLAPDERPSPAPPRGVTPSDLAIAFRQLELLVDFAGRLGNEPPIGVGAEPRPETKLVTESTPGGETRVRIEYEYSAEYGAEPPDVADLLWLDRSRATRELLRALSRSAPQGTRIGGIPEVTAVSVRMDSPLEVVLEIPGSLWPILAFGLLALGERIATAPVRIARKRKKELLDLAILDAQIDLVNSRDARALNVLGELLQDAGPRSRRGPDEIVFEDPGDSDDELIAANDTSSPG